MNIILNFMEIIKNIVVDTPQGKKQHGQIVQYKNGTVFYRAVRKKDLMRIFDAWSIHPEAWSQINREMVVGILYEDVDNNIKYKLKIEDLNDMYAGIKLDDKGNKLVFEKEFAGGKTIYIKRSAFYEQV